MVNVTDLEKRIQELEALLNKHRICPVFEILTRTALEEIWEECDKENLAIAFLDIDNLKFHNSKLGQYECNKRIAEAFSLARKSECHIGRFYSGDEIVILASLHEIQKPVNRIQKALQEKGMSATGAIIPYFGETSFSEAVKLANSIVEILKTKNRRGVVFQSQFI